MERLIVWHRWCPPPEASPEAVAQANLWRIQARGRLTALGGEIAAELGGTIVCALPSETLTAALEACLALSREVEQEENLEVGSVAYAVTLGSVERTHTQGPLVGDALDRAQALAAYADAGDVVLDQDAQSRSAHLYLFSGELRAGPSVSGALLDRNFPHRARCADALARLALPPLPATAHVPFDALRRLAGGSGRQRVLLVAPYGSGATAWLARIETELKPSAWLDVRGLGAGFAPLSGLRYALARLHGPARISTVLAGHEEPDLHALTTLTTIMQGGVAKRRDATMALRQYVGRCWEQTGRRALVSVNPVGLIDPATLSVVAEVAREGGPDCLVVMRVLPDAKPPEAFARGGSLAEIRVPGLAPNEGRALAHAMLGKETPIEIARRAASMGGNTPLGVAEAVRVLVSSGDIVPDERGFRWRRGPAARPPEKQIESLLEERMEQLDEDTRRVLEMLAWAPDPGERSLLTDVGTLEGLSSAQTDRAIEELALKAFIDVRGADIWLSHTVRRVVLGAMAPARSSALSLRLARALSRLCSDHSLFARADVAFYLARGGSPQEAVDMLLEAAMAAAQHGFVRSGVRLAAAAVECKPTIETRRKAASIAESLGRSVVSAQQPAPEAAPTPAAGGAPERVSHESVESASPEKLGDEAIKQAVRALRGRDYDGVERALELMIAAGRDGPHVDRIRAISQLEKGDRIAALRHFERASTREKRPDAPRTNLSRALLSYHGNDLSTAIRAALRALAQVREAGDALGENAVLRALAAFYRDAARDEQAKELLQLAAAQLPEGAVSGSSSP